MDQGPPDWLQECPTIERAYRLVEAEFPELLEQVDWRVTRDSVYRELEVSKSGSFKGIKSGVQVGRIGIVFDAEPGSNELECTPGWYGITHDHVFSWHYDSIETTVRRCFELIRWWQRPTMLGVFEHVRRSHVLWGLVNTDPVPPHSPPSKAWPRSFEEGEWLEFGNASGTIHGRVDGPCILEYDQFVELIRESGAR